MEGDAEQPVAERALFVGEGELPREFDRVNWGAYAFSYVWSLLYGPRRWAWTIWSIILVPILIENIVILFIDSARLPAVQRVLNPIWLTLLLGVSAYYSYHVDSWVWVREQRRISDAGDLPPRAIPLARYRKSRRFWTRLFLVLFSLSVVADVVLLALRQIGWRDALPGFGVIVPAALVALDFRRRRSRA